MDSDEDAALVDSFFLPGGILDPEKDEEVVIGRDQEPPPGFEKIARNPWNGGSTSRNESPSWLGGSFMALKEESPIVSLMATPTGSNMFVTATETNAFGSSEPIGAAAVSGSSDSFIGGSCLLGNFSPEAPVAKELFSSPPASYGRAIQRPTKVAAAAPSQEAVEVVTRNLEIDAVVEVKETCEDDANEKVAREPATTCDEAESAQAVPGSTEYRDDAQPSECVPGNFDDSLGLHTQNEPICGDKATEPVTDNDIPIEEKDEESPREKPETDSSVRSGSSIPLELFNGGDARGSSAASSLSSSCAENSDYSKTLPPKAPEEPETGSDNPLACRVSPVVEKGSSITSEQVRDDQPSEPPPRPKCHVPLETSEPTKFRSTVEEWIQAVRDRALSLTSDVSVASLKGGMSASFKARLQQSTVAKSLSKIIIRYESFSSQALATIRDLENQFFAVGEVLSPFLSRAISRIRTIVVPVITVLLIVANFLVTLSGHAIAEMLVEQRTTACYVFFFFLPILTTGFQDSVNLPHWSPHIISSVGQFILFNQGGQPGRRKKTEDDSENPANMKSAQDPTTNHRAQRSTSQTHSANRSQRSTSYEAGICSNILQIYRWTVLLVFVLDGFSKTIGGVMSLSDSGRLIAAFFLTMIRKQMIFSFVGWISWSLQVLVASNCPSFLRMDQLLVLMIGFSTLRLVRKIGADMAKEKIS